MKKPKVLVLFIISVLSLVIIYFAAIVILGAFTDYQPEEVTPLPIRGNGQPASLSDSAFTFITWNIGYSGLGAESDFFYDGGKQVHPTPQQVEKYNRGILNFIQSADTIDFILLQEVDKNSKRTNKQDQDKMIRQVLPKFSSSYGLNYNVQFVPLPFFNPLGKVEMGQMNLSGFTPESSLRHSYYSAYSWPKKLFMLDRCFIVSSFPLKNEKKLVVINTHNSAYDASGKLRKQEMPVIRDFMVAEYKKGNYVVAGGDWNQNPPGYKASKLEPNNQPVYREPLDSSLFSAGWTVAFDPQHPTNREIDAPFSKAKTGVTIIDYFIVSPNVNVESIKVLTQNFAYSDHEPVFMKINLKQ